MIHLIHNIILRHFFVLFVCLCAFASDLSAYEEYEEESLYCFSRYAFPTTCEAHFSNNTGIEHTWMEAENTKIINSFSNYLHTIPKIYDADCCHCYDCNGVKFNLYRGCDYPTDVEAFKELMKGHVQSMRGYGKYCIHDSDHCESLCWYGGYFRLWNHNTLGKSIFEHSDPQGLLNKFAGKGRPIDASPGSLYYKELVDFGENIGVWKDKYNTLSLPTTKGTIHYSKDGAHIIPAHPKSEVW